MSKFTDIISRKETIGGLSFVLGAAGGAFAGYQFFKKKKEQELEAAFDVRLKTEIENTQAYYSNVVLEKKPASPEEMLEELHGESVYDEEAHEALTDYQGMSVVPDIDEDSPVFDNPVRVFETEDTKPKKSKRVFDKPEAQPEFDLTAQMALRVPNKPYIMSVDEFNANESDFMQDELTYFEADDVLVDTQSIPIDDVDALVGDDNLVRFGFGSGDPNVLYIHNPTRELEMCILLSKGSYEEEVLGFQHSDKSQRSRRFRLDRD